MWTARIRITPVSLAEPLGLPPRTIPLPWMQSVMSSRRRRARRVQQRAVRRGHRCPGSEHRHRLASRAGTAAFLAMKQRLRLSVGDLGSGSVRHRAAPASVPWAASQAHSNTARHKGTPRHSSATRTHHASVNVSISELLGHAAIGITAEVYAPRPSRPAIRRHQPTHRHSPKRRRSRRPADDHSRIRLMTPRRDAGAPPRNGGAPASPAVAVSVAVKRLGYRGRLRTRAESPEPWKAPRPRISTCPEVTTRQSDPSW
jgi:hypothetical protein